MKVVLFCGGLGMRIRDNENVPKPMITIGYRPLVWHLMKYYAHFGFKDFVLCLGYRADYIKNYFLTYNECESNDFTLSLPISRHRIVITRIAAGYAIAAIALATSVAANGFVIAASDETVPIIPMLAASAFASLVILFWICVVTTLLTFAGANWGVVLTLFGMLFTSPLSMYGMSAAAAQSR